ncbi:MAG: ATP synthase F0 subunit B [Pyrinomonadaceae bacterium]
MAIFVMAGGSIQLVPDGTLVLHFIAIIVMVWILNRTLFGPINRILAERSLRTEGLLDEARQTVATIDEKLTACEQALRAARAEGYQLMETENADAVREREGQVAATTVELNKLTSDTKQRIVEELEVARQTLVKESYRIGLEIGSRILGRPISG